MVCPANLGWDLNEVARDCTSPAQVHDNLDSLIAAIQALATPGSHVLIMSNGGFGGLHGKLASALSA